MKKTKERGITLISLVITIIVLLILAGVSIATLTGDNGILTQSGKVKEKTKESAELEQVKLVTASAIIKGLGTIEDSKLKEEFEKEGLDLNKLTGKGPYIYKGIENIYKIEMDGTVKIVNLEEALNIAEFQNFAQNHTPNSIIFVSELDENVENMVDISNGHKTVYAWMDENTMYVGSNGKVLAPENCKNMFATSSMYNVSYVDARNLNVENTVDMSRMFWALGYSCTGSEVSINISGWNTSCVENMTWMFGYAGIREGASTGKTLIKGLKDFSVSKVTDMSYMFFNCQKLEELEDLSGWNTERVTTFNSMFNGCYNLKSLSFISNWNVENAKSIRAMFSETYNVGNFDVSSWNTTNVEDASYTFQYCNAKSVGDLSKWDTSNVTNMERMFFNTNRLESNLDLSSWNVDKVTSHDNFNTSAPKVIAPSWEN